MKKIFIISIITTMFLVGCSWKAKNNLAEDTVSKSNNTSNKNNKIEIEFEEYAGKDNVYPENIITINKKDIETIYWQKDFDSYKIAVALDKNDTMNILYIKDKEYTSICQKTNWTGGYEYVYENDDVDDVITEFENILGKSGIKIRILVGAGAVDVFYIAMNQERPSLLLSASISGDFNEFDIDGDGTKELLSFDEYMYIKNNDTIYKASYNYDKNQIVRVIFDDKLEDFVAYFSNKSYKEYTYDSKQRCLIEK